MKKTKLTSLLAVMGGLTLAPVPARAHVARQIAHLPLMRLLMKLPMPALPPVAKPSPVLLRLIALLQAAKPSPAPQPLAPLQPSKR